MNLYKIVTVQTYNGEIWTEDYGDESYDTEIAIYHKISELELQFPNLHFAIKLI